MGKSTISMVIFNSYVSHYQRVCSSPLAGTVPWIDDEIKPSCCGAWCINQVFFIWPGFGGHHQPLSVPKKLNHQIRISQRRAGIMQFYHLPFSCAFLALEIFQPENGIK